MALGVAMAAFAVVSVSVSWPRIAVSGKLRSIDLAIKNASTMEVVQEVQRSTGEWQEFVRTYYKDSAWRHVLWPGQIRETAIVVRDQKVLTDHKGLDYCVIKPIDPESYEEFDASNALSFAQHRSVFYRDAEKEIQDGPVVFGRPTRIVTVTARLSGQRARIYVDRETNLPILGIKEQRDLNGVFQRYRQRYRFNHPLDDRLFDLTSSKPIVDLLEEAPTLLAQWKEPIGMLGPDDIWDACVTRDGIVWIVATSNVLGVGGKWELRSNLPTYYSGSRSRGFSSATEAGARGAMIDGKPVWIAMFVPLNSTGPTPDWIELSFTKEGIMRGSTYIAEPEEPVTIRLEPRPEGARPFYLPALNLGKTDFQYSSMVLGMRAKGFAERGRFLEAAEIYDECAKAHRRLLGWEPEYLLDEIARCYRKAGRSALVDRVERRRKEIRAFRTSPPWYRP